MGFRKILSLTALVTGVYLMGRATAPDLGEVIDYVNSNPQHQEIVINKTMDYREEEQLGYSPKTLVNFSKALLYEFDKKDISMRGFDNKDKKRETSSKNSRKDALRKFSYMRDYIYDLVFSDKEGI